VIESSNPQQWLDYGTQVLGLMVAPGMPDDGNVYLKMDARPFRFAITPGDTDRLLLLGWELHDEADYESAKSSLQQAGVSFEQGSADDIAKRRVRDLIRLQDPAGNTLELYHGADLDYAKFISPTGTPEFETGFNGDMGFGHAVLPAPNLGETYAFYKGVLGFGETDYMHFKFSDDPADPGLGLNFMHVDNPRHHSLALYQGESPAGCIHLMIEVETVDEVGYCLDRVLEREIPVTSTLGRHTNDRMLSFYMMTPGGFPMEFGCEGLQMDWSDYTPTKSALPSIWGHKFVMPE
jgi:3,4-dihydroxy-9,10-secoandrosta-1,3,5(10)-triene-9,17-dione 4,5-dioxygenase